jgi:anthranilate synthase/aminodeoxychorismate synthase-like glutamine amidotransferase
VSQVRVLLIDNHDSFTYNLAQYLGELGAAVEVVLSDRVAVVDIHEGRCDAVVISPGPGRPEEAGISVPLVRARAATLPMLGVCLGHQAIVTAFGGRIGRAAELVHGKASLVRHDGRGVFEGLANPFPAARYHSLAAERETMPDELEECAVAADGTIQGVRHKRLPLHGVQFHPESILTPDGKQLLRNFLVLAAAAELRVR